MDIETQFYEEEGGRASNAFESTAANQNVDTNNSISANNSPKKSTLVGLNQPSGDTNVGTSTVEEHAPTQEFVEESEAESDEMYEDDFEVHEEVSQNVESQFSVSDDPEGIFSTQKKSGSQEILSPDYQRSKRPGGFEANENKETQDVIETLNPPEEDHFPGSTAVEDDFTATQVVHEEDDDVADVNGFESPIPTGSVTQIVDNDHCTNEVVEDDNGINNPPTPSTRKDVAHTDGNKSKGIAILEEELRQAKASLALEKAKCRDAIALNDRNVALKIETMGGN